MIASKVPFVAVDITLCLPVRALLTWEVATEVLAMCAVESIAALNLHSGSPIPV